jgi:hypothetical protein
MVIPDGRGGRSGFDGFCWSSIAGRATVPAQSALALSSSVAVGDGDGDADGEPVGVSSPAVGDADDEGSGDGVAEPVFAASHF